MSTVSKNNVSKNKLLFCFRPVVHLEAMPMLHSKPALHRSSTSRFSCVPVTQKHQIINSDTKPVFFDQGCPKYTQGSIKHHPPKRTLSLAIKALVLGTILNRRARRESRYRKEKDSYGSKRSFSAYSESSSAGDDKSVLSQPLVYSNIQETKTKTESPLSSSSSQGSASSCASPVSEWKKQKENSHQDQSEKQKKIDCSGMYFLLLSFTLTVLWGKFLGVILTSIWFYFFSLWDASYRQPKEVAKFSKEKSRVYKNRGHNGRSAGKDLP